jgi:hypothetical protein
MNKVGKFVLACSMPVALAAPALAHHSAAAFNTQQEVKVTGTITEYRYRNPHVYMVLQVKKAERPYSGESTSFATEITRME